MAIQVEIEPTKSSARESYNLTLREHNHGWPRTDLTREDLQEIRGAIDRFLSWLE